MSSPRRFVLALLALGLSGAVVAGPRQKHASTYARVVAAGADARRLAALERARTPLARRVIEATWRHGSTPTRFGEGGGRTRANGLRRR